MKECTKEILLATEDKEWCRITAGLLVPHGYIVHTAHDGNDVISMVKMRQYRILFLTINLPGINGMQALEEIGKMEDKPTVIMICKENMKHNIREYLMNGAYICLWKTFKGEDILAVCNKLLEKEVNRSKIRVNSYCPFYRSALMKCYITEGAKGLDDFMNVVAKCTADNYYECPSYRDIKKQRDGYKGVERRKAVRIDTDIPMRYEICGEAGIKHARVRDISKLETILMIV